MKFLYSVCGILLLFVCSTFRQTDHLTHSVFVKNTDSLYSVMQLDKSFNNNILFKIVDNIPELRKRIPTGEYILKRTESTYSFLLKLMSGQFIRRKITFPEGITVYQILERLNQNTILTGKVAKTPKEGSLMPDTYFYKFGDTRQNIINRMKDEMTKFKTQTNNTTNLSWNEVITLASIIELEAGHSKDHPIISSVLHNRLKKGMRLESDPTVIYALTINGVYKGAVDRKRILHKDLFVKSPYNTYRNKGLPPTPICCPGRVSIKAAIHPANTSFLFFIADLNTREVFYSDTLKQHNKYRAEIKKRQSSTT